MWSVFMQWWLQWKNSQYYITWVSVCSLWYLASNLHSPCCHLWSVRFSALCHKRHDFRKKKIVTDHKMCVLNFFTSLSETTFVLRRIERNMIKGRLVFMYSTRYYFPILRKLQFLDKFEKKYKKSANSMKIRRVGAEIFYAGGRTDMTKLIFAFRNFANKPKMV
jgi:hypothetical protein